MSTTWQRIYTDLDGTLLDHHSYDWSPAAALLKQCREQEILVIPNSSKTADELAIWLDELDLPGYAVAENGGMILLPESHDYWRSHAPDWEGERTLGVLMTRPYGAVCQWLDEMRTRHQFAYTGFHDADAPTVAAWTGLTEAQASLAMQRQSGEALLWEDSDEALAQLTELAQADNWQVQRGGRFVHVGDEVDKATAMSWLESHLPEPGVTLALGDGDNDRAMLQAAGTAVVVRRPDGSHLTLERDEVYYTPSTGPKGWCEGVNRWLQREDRDHG